MLLKKGNIEIKPLVASLMGMLIMILVFTGVSDSIFGTSGLNATTFTATAPEWLVTILPIIVGVSIILFFIALWKIL